MTDDKDLKRLVRQRMAKTGESYTTARAHFRPPTRTGDREAVDAFRQQILSRSSLERLGNHLEDRYDIGVKKLTELDLGVFRVSRSDGRDWVARVFPAARPTSHVEGDAEILRHLADHAFPAERCANDQPVSVLDGQGVLVTEHIAGLNARFDTSGHTLSRLGDAVGRLHTLPVGQGATTRAAGSWHSTSVLGGGVRADVETLLPLMASVEPTVPAAGRATFVLVRDRLQAIDDCHDLPHALTHPDPGGANAIVPTFGDPLLVDWTGAGRGPRLLAFAALIAGSLQPLPGHPISRELQRVDAIVAGYRKHVRLDHDEVARLPGVIAGMAIPLAVWMFLFQDVQLSEAALADVEQMAESAGRRVAEALQKDDAELTAWYAESPPPVDPNQLTLL